MTNNNLSDARLLEALAGCFAQLTPERLDECRLLAESGMEGEYGTRLRLSEDDPSVFDVVYGGAVIGSIERAWLCGDDPTEESV